LIAQWWFKSTPLAFYRCGGFMSAGKIWGTPMFRRNRIQKQGKASRTAGKTKGLNCQTDPQKKFYASSPKAFRDPQYNVWHDEFKRMNKV
jgi:hypothetical protein